MAIAYECVEDLVHRLTFFLHVVYEGRIQHGPGLELPFLLRPAEGGTGVRHYRVNPGVLRQESYGIVVEDRRFVLPPERIEAGTYFPSSRVLLHARQPVDAHCSADAEDGVAAGLDDGIVGDAPPSFEGYLLPGEVRRVVVVAAYESDVVVCLRELSGNLPVDGFIETLLLEPEAAVAGDDK